MSSNPTASVHGFRSRRFKPLPPEGEGGYSETWWPVCLAAEVGPDSIKSVDMLGGRVVVARDSSGTARVLSAYCLHLGADLCAGKMIEGQLQCPFHHWRYDVATGTCLSTGIGDPVPPSARLFSFPTVERYGLIWAFNASEPRWPFPDFFPCNDADLEVFATYDEMGDFACDAWVAMANTPDWNHLMAVHRLAFDGEQLNRQMVFTDHSFFYHIDGKLEHGSGADLSYDRWVYGTNTFVMYGTLGGEWFGVSNPLLQVAPGRSRNFFISVVKKSGSAEEDRRRVRAIYRIGQDMVNEDRDILDRIRFKQGLLTPADSGTAKFLDYVRNYPRSNEAADFIS